LHAPLKSRLLIGQDFHIPYSPGPFFNSLGPARPVVGPARPVVGPARLVLGPARLH